VTGDSWDDIRTERTLMDDEAVLALNKPYGVSVMGERHDTDLVRMAAAAGSTLYPVHRIDKATSGTILFAKSLTHHGDLTRQFNKRTVDKSYLALTRTRGLPDRGVIDLPLSVGRKNRVRVAAAREAITRQDDRWTVPPAQVFDHVKSYPSVTEFAKVWQDRHFSLLALRPLTGRRHQIRVHLAWIGHPVHADPLFDKDTAGERMLLHSWRLAFDAAWRHSERIVLEAAPGDDFWSAVAKVDTAAVLTRAEAALDG
jgi:tRNA pseudouridine32 synthase/23S rRNA pseudouridine746 synthase